MDRSNRLACGYSIIRAADIHRFLGLSMLRQNMCQVAGWTRDILADRRSAEPRIPYTDWGWKSQNERDLPSLETESEGINIHVSDVLGLEAIWSSRWSDHFTGFGSNGVARIEARGAPGAPQVMPLWEEDWAHIETYRRCLLLHHCLLFGVCSPYLPYSSTSSLSEYLLPLAILFLPRSQLIQAPSTRRKM